MKALAADKELDLDTKVGSAELSYIWRWGQHNRHIVALGFCTLFFFSRDPKIRSSV